MDLFRIHGDNVVECERIASLLIAKTRPSRVFCTLTSPSTITFNIFFNYEGINYEWQLDLLPGFNKAGRHRWQDNIFNPLHNNGSFLEETPDAIVTKVVDGIETIIYAIEFCSALQAGNQAWQRSGRAFSTGRTQCPYIYIVDFVKYELDSRTRERKALRFPNPAVPYSYINFSMETGNFVAQVYVRAEEFDKLQEPILRTFDENNFATKELSTYLVRKMCGLSTASVEQAIFAKNLGVVSYLASSSNANTNFVQEDWNTLYNSRQNIIDYSVNNSSFPFRKIITNKGHHGQSAKVLDAVVRISKGLASKDLPFGIIPAANRPQFAKILEELYPNFDKPTLDIVAENSKDLVLCILKGFKPRGDDNRPDRGLLPFISMLSSSDTEIMTYIYGPVLENNYISLVNYPKKLAYTNGLWKSILALSDYVALDVPILSSAPRDASILINTKSLKEYYSGGSLSSSNELSAPAFPSRPLEYHEDDVDTGIHFLFAHLLNNCCFEGMCNPPGGDWSGFSVIHNNVEARWLSLPRVSTDVDGKRPDHILQIFNVFDKPLLLSIESKERSIDLEPDVGTRLINYIRSLMNFVPNVTRQLSSLQCWNRGTFHIPFEDYYSISAAAYLQSCAQPNDAVFANSNCDMLFVMDPTLNGWDIEIVTQTREAAILKEFLISKISSITAACITLH